MADRWSVSNGHPVLPASTDRQAFESTWYCEIRNYDFNNPTFKGGFTSNCQNVKRPFYPGCLERHPPAGLWASDLYHKWQSGNTLGMQICPPWQRQYFECICFTSRSSPSAMQQVMLRFTSVLRPPFGM